MGRGLSAALARMDFAAEEPERPPCRDSVAFFEGLLKRLSPTLRRIIRKLNGHFTFMDDQDLFQEALIHLWTHVGSGDLDDKTDSYILQGCYFHLKNYIRKTQDSATVLSLTSVMEEDGSCLEELLVSNEVASYDQVEGSLQIEAIAGKGATQRERDVLLFCLEGMTTREIGRRLGISHVSVVKIRNKIKDRYEALNRIDGMNGPARSCRRNEKSSVAGYRN